MSNKPQSEWEKRFDEIFYYQKVNKPNGGYLFVCQNSHLKSFISTQIQQARAEVLKEILPKKKEIKWDNPPREIQDTDYKLGEKIGFNLCRQEIINKALQKWGIKINPKE